MTAASLCRRARLGLSLACAAAVTGTSPAVSAQEYMYGADAGISSGIEGGGSRGILRMPRTRLRLGVDARINEAPADILEVGLLAEILPRSGFGADVRYAHMAGQRFVLDLGLTSILAPSSLYGVCAGLTYRLPISKTVQITIGPEGDFYFLGADLPDGTVIWQLRLQGGLRVDL
jgi:hypothetical protein